MKHLTYLLSLIVVGLTPLDAITIAENMTIGRIFYIFLLVSAFFSRDLFLYSKACYIKILFTFVFWSFLTSLWSVDIEETLYRCLYLVQYLFLVIILQNTINTSQRLRYLCFSWFCGTLFIAIKTIIDYSINGLSSISLYRVNEFGNANENSFMLCFGVILFLVANNKSKYTYRSYIALFISFLAILANGSRTGFLMYLFVVGIYFLFEIINKNKLTYYVFPFFVFLGIYYFNNILSESSYERFMNISTDIQTDNLANRTWIWDVSFRILSQKDISLLFGTGWGTFPKVFQSYTGILYGSHNFYLNVLFTTGIIGFIIVLCYLVVLYVYIHRIKKERLLYLLLLIVPMISMFTTNWESRRWWFLMGVFIYKLNEFSKYYGEKK